MKHTLVTALATTLACATSITALADDSEGLREETQCQGFWDAVEALDKFADIDADRRDVVDILPRPRFADAGDVPQPDRVFFKLGEEERDLVVTSDGEVEGVFETARAMGEDAEMCVTDTHFAGTPKSEPGRNFYVGMIPEFKAAPGRHTLAELEEGGKDGKKFFKKLAPGPLSMFVPSLDHIMVSHPFDDVDALPRVYALRGTEELGQVTLEPLDTTQLLSLETLEEMGADAIRVEGAYRLFPMPDAKTIRRFMD